MTKVYEDRVVQTRCHSDTICDACGASCMKSCGVECGNLFASWDMIHLRTWLMKTMIFVNLVLIK